MAHGTIRFSFSRDNCDEDVDRVLEVLPGIVERLRSQSRSGHVADTSSRVRSGE
jgi:cysteine desulfurase